MQPFRTAIFAGMLSCLVVGAAQAALQPTLGFVTPSATVAPTDEIEVWLRLTVGAGSDPLVIDSSQQPLVAAGFELPATASVFNETTQESDNVAFAEYSGVFLNTFYACSGTFAAAGCGGGEPGSVYRFNFWLDDTNPAKPSINFRRQFSLQPGQSFDFLFGTFSPVGGVAPEGQYTYYDAGLTLQVDGRDAAGRALSAEVAILASTCGSETANCAFTRTVTAPIPEPGSYGLMALGLLGLAGWQRRRCAT